MISRSEKDFNGIYGMGAIITTVYKGVTLVWEAIRSCFGNGLWFNDKPWINDDPWKNK